MRISRKCRTDSAEKRVAYYEKEHKDIPLNSQFILFMRGRLAELKEDNARALEYYEKAVKKPYTNMKTKKIYLV